MATLFKVLHVKYNYALSTNAESLGFSSDSSQNIFVKSVDVSAVNLSGTIHTLHFEKDPKVNVDDEITIRVDQKQNSILVENITQRATIDNFIRKQH